MMKLLSRSRWIGALPESPSPVILRRFQWNSKEKATLSLCGLGWFYAEINGRPVTDEMFVPVSSQVGWRDISQLSYHLHDELSFRVYGCSYDVTGLLKEGENLLTVQLGNGWYRQKERVCEGDISYGDTLKAIYSITAENVQPEEWIVSDGSETFRESEIVYNNIYIGEVIDFGSVTGEEKPVTLQPAPDGELMLQQGTPDRVISIRKPKLLGIRDGKQVFDVGEAVSGLVRVRVASPAGEKTVLSFAEDLHEDLTLGYASAGAGYICASGRDQIQRDEIISDGTDRVYCPKFAWHAFRYFEIEGNFTEPEVLVIHSDTPITSTFESSSEGLNYLYKTFLRTQLNNMHCSYPSDCPHRERLGYTGDGQLCAEAVMTMLDSREFYRKWIGDILDSQDKKGGHVQHTAPLCGGGGGPGGWGCAIVIVPYVFYKHFGETEILKECYMPMRRWTEYLDAHSEDGLVMREEGDGWCLGDWCPLGKVLLPEPFVNSLYYARILKMLEEIAAAVGMPEDIPGFRDKRMFVLESVRRHYLKDGAYLEGVQGADAYAFWSGLEGKSAAERTAKRYDALGHFDTGFLGTDALLEVLMDAGYADIALKLLESEELGSFLYMKRNGATTLWETWNADASHDHPMFGGCARHLFSGFLGITQEEGSAGYENIVLAPQVPKGLKRCSGSLLTPAGRIGLGWVQDGDGIRFTVTVPEGKTAAFRFNGKEIAVSGHQVLNF